MECNKDEATRAKSMAEGKLEKKDYSGAKKFALKAQSLYPGLDGISQMLKILDVYVSAENTIFGLVDWYGVLGVNPSADDATIKKQYRKLALMVHPDKNSCVGADGAFKLISEAWKFLSDKALRLEYNKKREYKGFQQNVPTAPSRPCQPNVSTYSPFAPFRPSQHNGPGQSAPMPQDRKQTHYTSCQQKVPRHTGGPSAPSRPRQSNVSTHSPSAPSMPSHHKVPGQSAPKPQDRNRNADVSRKETHATSASKPCQQKVPRYTGGLSSPSQSYVSPNGSAPKLSQDSSADASRKRTHATSTPFRPCQQKVPRYTGGPSSPSTPGKHKVPGPSAPANVSCPKSVDKSAKALKKQTVGPVQRTIDALWTTGGPSAPSRPSPGVPLAPSNCASGPSLGVPVAPSNCASRKASSSAPSRPSPSVPLAPSNCASRKAPKPLDGGKFWTTCRQCGAQHEYLKIFRNCTLLCDKCIRPFTASETVRRPNL